MEKLKKLVIQKIEQAKKDLDFLKVTPITQEDAADRDTVIREANHLLRVLNDIYNVIPNTSDTSFPQMMGVLKVGRRYRHYKGDLYKILFFSQKETNGEFLVSYHEVGQPVIYSRPYYEFVEIVSHAGQFTPRFMEVENE